MNKITKPILFYSTQCSICSDVINKMTKANILNLFILVNVSKPKYKIPKIITRVPSIFINNQVLVDDNFDEYVSLLIDKIYGQQNIEPFTTTELGSGISSSFSYIPGLPQQEGCDDNIKNTFGFIGEEFENQFHIECPEAEPIKVSNDNANQIRDNSIKPSRLFSADNVSDIRAQREAELQELLRK